VIKRMCLVFCVFGAACGSGDDTDGPMITPHVSPVQLGEFWPQGTTDADPGNNERTPFEWVLLLQSTGDETLKVSKACLIGDASNFVLEGPVPADIRAGDEGAVRLTYGRTSPGSDRVAVLVESNATKFSRLIVPVCAAVVADGADKNKAIQPCEFEVPADAACP
jgi:hypothetical protein